VPHKFRIKYFADLNIDNHPVLIKDRRRLTKHMLRVHFIRLSRSIRNLQLQLHDAWYSFHNTFLHEMFIKNIVYCMNIIASSVMMHKFHTHHDKFNRLVEYCEHEKQYFMPTYIPFSIFEPVDTDNNSFSYYPFYIVDYLPEVFPFFPKIGPKRDIEIFYYYNRISCIKMFLQAFKDHPLYSSRNDLVNTVVYNTADVTRVLARMGSNFKPPPLNKDIDSVHLEAEVAMTYAAERVRAKVLSELAKRKIKVIADDHGNRSVAPIDINATIEPDSIRFLSHIENIDLNATSILNDTVSLSPNEPSSSRANNLGHIPFTQTRLTVIVLLHRKLMLIFVEISYAMTSAIDKF